LCDAEALPFNLLYINLKSGGRKQSWAVTGTELHITQAEWERYVMGIMDFGRWQRNLGSSSLSFSPTLNLLSYEAKCIRYLCKAGWTTSKGYYGLKTVTKSELSARIIFVPPRLNATPSTQKEWLEIYVNTWLPVIIVSYSPVSEEAQDYLKGKVWFLNYVEMDEIDSICTRCLAERNEQVRGLGTRFDGAVEGFNPPSTLRGWVRLVGPNGPTAIASITVYKDDVAIGTGAPRSTRPDIIGDPSYLSGFSIKCDIPLTKIDILERRIRVVARDMSDEKHYLTIWQGMLQNLSLQVQMEASPTFASSDIVKVIKRD